MRINRLFVTLIVLLILQVVFFTAVILAVRQERLKDAELAAANIATVARSATDDFFKRYLAIFDALKSVDHIERQEPEASHDIMRRLKQKYPEIVNFAAVKKDGYFFASGMPMLKNNIPNIKHLEFFQRIRSGEKLVFMQPHIGPISGELVTGVVVPLEDNIGLYNGLIGVSIKFQNLVDQWETLFSNATFMMAVHDNKGGAYYASPGLEKYKHGLSGHLKPGKPDRIQLGKQLHTLYTVTDPGSGWRISAIVPVQVAITDLMKFNIEIMFLMVLIFITIAALWIWYQQEQREEEKFKHVFETANVGKSITLPSGRVSVNKALADMLGYKREELRSKTWQELTPPDEIATVEAVLAPLMNDKKDTARFKKGYLCKDGSTIQADVSVAMQRNEKGKPLYFITTVIDITERFQLEQQLQTSEAKYRHLFETMTQGVIIQDANGGIVEANHAACEILGLTMDQMLGKTAYDPRWRLIHEDGSSYDPAEMPSNIVLRTGKPSKNVHCGIYVPEKDEYRWIMIGAAPWFKDGETNPFATMTVFTDVTALKLAKDNLIKTESRYRLLFENMNAGFVLFEVVQDEEGTPIDLIVIAANKGFEATTGLNARDVAGKCLTKVLPGIEDDAADWIGTYGNVALTGRPRQMVQGSELLGTYYTIIAYQAGPGQCAVTFIDITDQKKSEIALKKSQGLLSTLLHTIPDLVWLKDVDGVYQACNQRFESFFGAKEKDIVGKTDYDFVGRELADSFRNHDREAMEKNEPSINEEEIEFRDDGHREILETIKTPMYSSDGKLLGVLGIGRDITRRRLAEKALKESEQKLSTLLGNLQGIAYRCRNDRDWTMVFMSEGCRQLTGYDPDDFVKSDKFAYADIIHPQDRPRVWDAIQRDLADNKKFDIEYRIVTAGGDQKWVNERGLQVGFDDDGTILLEGFISDISEQKRIEEELRYQERLLGETGRMAKVGGWRFDPATGEGTWTAETARIHDLDPEEETNVAKGLAFYHGEHRQKIEKAIRDAVESGRSYDLELEMVTARNRHKTVRIIGRPVVRKNRTVEVGGSIQDVTDHVRLQNELKRSHSEIRNLTTHLQNAMENERIAIAREIHDDFGQTLSALKLDMGWIRKRLHPDQTSIGNKLADMTAAINDSVGSVKRICANLRPAILDDFGLVSAIHWLASQYQDRTNIQIELTFNLDESTISQDMTTAAFRICQEALTNVNRYAEATRVEISLAKQADRMVLQIGDNGRGIADLEAAMTGSFGLIGMRERALALGGDFSITGKSGKGTRISASFPFDNKA